MFNYLIGSLTRIYTTLQEVDDKLVLYTFVTGFILNAILAAQMAYYWNSPTTAPHAEELGREPRKIAMAERDDDTLSAVPRSSSVPSPNPKSPTTRRRA